MFESVVWDIFLCWVILFFIAYFFVKDRYGYFKRRGIPYDEPVLFLGSTWRNVLGGENLVIACHKIYTRNGDKPLVGMYQGIKPTLLIRDPRIIEDILIKEFSNFHDRGIPTDEEINPLEGSIFNLKGEKWRALRAKLIPSFSSAKLKGMLLTMQQSVQSLAEEFQPFDGQIFEMKKIFTRLNLHIIGKKSS